MKRDLIIGLLVSILVHGGLGWGGEFMKGKKKKVVEEEGDEMTVMVQAPPAIEPEEVEADTSNENQSNQPTEQSFAPPTLVDAPQAVNFDSFTQQLQPPPPPNVNVSKQMSVPKGPPATGAVARNMANVFNIKDLDQRPEDRPGNKGIKPNYPYDLKRAGVTGSVQIEFIIDENGNVIDAWVTKATNREFEQPTLQAAMRWKFKPGRKGGKAVKVRASRLVPFQISDNE